MKLKITPLVLVAILCLQLTNCNRDDDGNQLLDPVTVLVPVIKSKSEVRNSIAIREAQPTNSDGKIYVYNDLLFYIAQNSGIHIFNNQNPENPQNLAFIDLEGAQDISVKDNILYANNFMDIVVFDISTISNIQLVNIEENMLPYYATFPEDMMYFQSDIFPSNDDEFIANYTTVKVERTEIENNPHLYFSQESILFNDALASAVGTVGVGGSYARFQIYENALYIIDDYKLNTFDITDYNAISQVSELWMGGWFGGVLETTFIQKEFLFIGATNGMHVVNLQEEFSPTYTSSFMHATGCDPVVVQGNTAYITIRGGNSCGAIEDQINVIDITDITMPTEYSTYFLSSPYGLGVRHEVLYVCNDEGIQVFDVQNPSQIVLENTIETTCKDVIPLASHLIVVGENVIYQYDYVHDYELELISTIQF